jgi:hypothetical protein
MPTLREMLQPAVVRAVYELDAAVLWKGLSEDMKAFLPSKHSWMVKYVFVFGSRDNAGTRYFTGTCNEFRDWANQLKTDTGTPWMQAYILPTGMMPWRECNYEWVEGFDFSL